VRAVCGCFLHGSGSAAAPVLDQTRFPDPRTPNFGGVDSERRYLASTNAPATAPNSMLDSVPGKLDVRLAFIKHGLVWFDPAYNQNLFFVSLLASYVMCISFFSGTSAG